MSKLEISEETFSELSQSIRGALAVIPTIRGIVPPHVTERLEGCLAKARGALESIVIVEGDPHEATH